MPEIMWKMIVLVLKCIKRIILDPPVDASSSASSNFNKDGNFNPNIATPDMRQSVNVMDFERFANSRAGLIFLNSEYTTPNKPFADKYFLDNN